MPGDELDVVVARRLFVPRELVFDVWTQPEHLSLWYSPGPDFQRRAEAEVARGGRYSIWWADRDGREFRQSGEYEVVMPPELLVYSARYDSERGPTYGTRVTVEFHDLGGATRIEITVAGCPENLRGAQEHHWAHTLDQLETYFTSI